MASSTWSNRRVETDLIDKFEKLLRIDRTLHDVPAAANEVVTIVLNLGNNEEISRLFVQHLENCIFCFNEFCIEKVVRVLWVIGYLLLKSNVRKVNALKPLLIVRADKFYRSCLERITKGEVLDESSAQFAREELRCILKFWQCVMPDGVVQLILGKLRSVGKFKWVLDNQDIRPDVRIFHMYKNTYTIKTTSKTPLKRARELDQTGNHDKTSESRQLNIFHEIPIAEMNVSSITKESSKVEYLPRVWSNADFINAIFNPNVKSWDIVAKPDGKLVYVRIEKKIFV